jgi:hypothetical protein
LSFLISRAYDYFSLPLQLSCTIGSTTSTIRTLARTAMTPPPVNTATAFQVVLPDPNPILPSPFRPASPPSPKGYGSVSSMPAGRQARHSHPDRRPNSCTGFHADSRRAFVRGVGNRGASGKCQPRISSCK